MPRETAVSHSVTVATLRTAGTDPAAPDRSKACPCSVLAITGKIDTMNADATTVFIPYPNQITSSGAIAMIGTV